MKPGIVQSLICLVAPALALRQVTVPANLGPWAVSISEHQLDTSRPDVLAPVPHNRKLMLSVFQPTYAKTDCPHYDILPYTSEPVERAFVKSTADNNYVQLPENVTSYVKLASCPLEQDEKPASEPCNDAPLLLFSPGLKNERELYSLICQAVASSGYTVISMDYPYETDVVRFADGSLIYSVQNSTDANSLEQYIDVDSDIRVADALSVLDAIDNGEIPGLIQKFSPGVKVGMFGHSLGGSTAAQTAQNSSRIAGALNYDGGFFSSVPNTTIEAPLFMFGEQVAPVSPEFLSWEVMWEHAVGYTTEWSIDQTMHNSFTDYPLWFQMMGLREENPLVDSYIGTIDGLQMQSILWAYSVAFFDYVMKGKSPRFLNRFDSNYPDVHLARQKNATTTKDETRRWRSFIA